MKEEGIVKSINGDMAVVVIRRKTACGDNCATCSGACRRSFQEITAKNLCKAKEGEYVSVEMDTGKVFLSAFFVYILPLMVFVTAYGIGGIYLGEGLNVALSVVLAILSFAPAIILDRRKKDDFVHKIVQIYKNT